MNDTAIKVNQNELGIEKLYFNNVRTEAGVVSCTLTAVNGKEQKVATEVTSCSVNIKDHLIPAGLKALGLSSDEYPAEEGAGAEGELNELLKKALSDNEELEKANDNLLERNEKLDDEKREIKGALNSSANQTAELRGKLEAAEKEAADLKAKLEAAEKQIADLSKPAETLKAQLEATQSKQPEGKKK